MKTMKALVEILFARNLVAGISPCYRCRNGSLLSIGQKGRFLLGKRLKGKWNVKNINKSKDGEPLYKQRLGFRFQRPANND